jgi:hypothetical protein
MKEILEVVLKTGVELVQSYLQKRFPDKSTPAEKRRLGLVIFLGFALGTTLVVAVILIAT